MTEKAKRQDRDEAREDRERRSAEMSHELAPELAPERATQDDLTGANTAENDATGATEGAAQPASVPARARSRRTTRKVAATQAEPAEAITPPVQEPAHLSAIEADKIELEAQGFSADEAQRLIDISKRLETSAEARASQAELKRLRFTQWLIEHGILDEFSA